MNESKHTPGPWKIVTEFSSEKLAAVTWGPTIRGSDGQFVCVADHSALKATDANARLIAAAPDLLEALRDACMLLTVNGSIVPESTGQRIDAAIKKATGGTLNCA